MAKRVEKVRTERPGCLRFVLIPANEFQFCAKTEVNCFDLKRRKNTHTGSWLLKTIQMTKEGTTMKINVAQLC